jgi:hypothetical protein
MKTHHSAEAPRQYLYLAIMAVLSFISMYILMYAMVDTFGNVYPNLNQFYMAGLMTAPMIVIELILMRAMYKNKKANAIILTSSVVLLIGFWLLIRAQTAITDTQFVRSMIPHHAGALLMCDGAALKDPELIELCKNIKAGQQREIDQMKAILARLEN